MQIDFHHTATYVIARFAGFEHEQAEIIAHSAQYVDDATNSGAIAFDNGAMFNRISSAHKMLDYRNFEELANHTVWIPFHFLPGNGGLKAGENPEGSFIEKIICRPNSYVAKDMVAACIRDRDKAYGLHRLGVTMHVYADTWAHQGFAGVNHKINHVEVLDDNGAVNADFSASLADFFGDTLDKLKSKAVSAALPLGHGAVLSYPDRPYLQWSYKSSDGTWVSRDNPRDFVAAADEMCKAMRRYQLGDPEADVQGIDAGDMERFGGLIREIQDEDGAKRHEKWLLRIRSGYFSSIGRKNLTYIEKGEGSWKYDALGTDKAKDKGNEVYSYDDAFLSSNWKLFHDAIIAHRFAIIHDILPRYGICAS